MTAHPGDFVSLLQAQLARVRDHERADEPITGASRDEQVVITADPAGAEQIVVSLEASLLPRQEDRERVGAAVQEAVAALLRDLRQRTALPEEVTDSLTGSARDFLRDGQQHLEAQLDEVERRFGALRNSVDARRPHDAGAGVPSSPADAARQE